MSIVIGVDVAKKFSTYTFLDSNGTVIQKPFNVNNDFFGLQSIISKIEKVTNDHNDNAVIIMESTGYFSNRLRDFFDSNDLKVLEINPLVSHSIRNASIRKVKNDKSDSYDLANLYLSSKQNKHLSAKLRPFHKEDERIINLRTLTRFRQKLVKDCNILKLRLKADLEQVLPSYNKVFKTYDCKSSLALLDAIDWNLNVSKKAMIQALKTVTPNRSQKYFDAIYDRLSTCLYESRQIGRNIPAFFITIHVNVSLISKYTSEIIHIENQIDEIASTLDNVRLLKTIPGISNTIASIIVSEIGDIHKFKNAKSLVAYCGIDPSVKQSGEYNKLHNQISKRGSPKLRSALYMAALKSITKYQNGRIANQVLYDYYQLKRKSKPGNVALGAVMNKLVRIIFSILNSQNDFIMITKEQQCLLYEHRLKVIA